MATTFHLTYYFVLIKQSLFYIIVFMKGKEDRSIQGIRECVLLGDKKLLADCIERIFAEREYNQKEIAELHDDLLFSMAYAHNAEIYNACQTALRLLPELVKPGKLQDSGIANSVVVSSFTFSLLKWMDRRFPGKLFFHSLADAKEDIGETISCILPSSEAEICSFGYSKDKLFSLLCGGKISVSKIIAVFDACEDDKLRNLAFSRLGLYVELHLTGDCVSRSNALAPVHEVFYHDEILKKFDAAQLIRKRLPKKRLLRTAQLEQLVTTSRMMLASLGRETDPVTFCKEEETEYYQLERGFSIALFSLEPGKRLAFDSYIGFMMFKNGLPVAYGGAWIFFHRALIGINIFEAYRGGESSFLFAQLLRVYHQRYKADRFSVEPYQYGKDNPEGIASGAYWFYYRFGFRSDDTSLAQIAEVEQKKIKAGNSYRTSPDVLKQFTKSNITLELKEGAHGLDPSKLSVDITHYVGKYFNGDRKKAIKAGHSILKNYLRSEISMPRSELLKKTFENWCLAFLVLDPKGKADKKDKLTFVKMLRAKTNGTEADYIKFTQQLRGALERGKN